MSLKTKIGTSIDIATLIGASAMTVGGVVATYKMLKAKKEWYAISAAIVVILVGVSATKYSIESIKKTPEV